MTRPGLCIRTARCTASEISIDVARLLRDAGPWGQAFPEPLFDGCFEVRSSESWASVICRLELHADGGVGCEAIAFRHFDHDDAPVVRPNAAWSLPIASTSINGTGPNGYSWWSSI